MMSTTLVPPSYYQLTLAGEPPHLYGSLREAAAAIVASIHRPEAMTVVTGGRPRGLTPAEQCDLDAWIAQHRRPVQPQTIPYPRRGCTRNGRFASR